MDNVVWLLNISSLIIDENNLNALINKENLSSGKKTTLVKNTACNGQTWNSNLISKLRDLLRKGPKYKEPVSYSWHQNFDIIMDA